jgi:hypothetical protein
VRLLARHLRGNAVAYLAIFVALGGTSYAAVAIPNNSVGNKQLKKDAVDSKKVKNKTLTADDVKAGEAKAGPQGIQGVIGSQGQQGGKGLQGDQGDKGGQGDQGPPGTRLTPSQSVSSDPTPDIDILSTDTVVLTAPALVTTEPTKLVAAGNGLFFGDSSTAMNCVLKLATDGGAKAAIGQPSDQTFPTMGFTAPGAVVATTNIAAGSHVVTYECKDQSSTAGTGAELLRGDLRVTTVAQ